MTEAEQIRDFFKSLPHSEQIRLLHAFEDGLFAPVVKDRRNQQAMAAAAPFSAAVAQERAEDEAGASVPTVEKGKDVGISGFSFVPRVRRR